MGNLFDTYSRIEVDFSAPGTESKTVEYTADRFLIGSKVISIPSSTLSNSLYNECKFFESLKNNK